jgi:hypothetical protein
VNADADKILVSDDEGLTYIIPMSRYAEFVRLSCCPNEETYKIFHKAFDSFQTRPGYLEALSKGLKHEN